MADAREPTTLTETALLAAAAPAARGFARLAWQISSWTSRALLSAIVLVAGVAFGRQVLVWWAADSPEGKPIAQTALGYGLDDGLGDPTRPHFIEFGDQSWGFSQQMIKAPPEKVRALLRASCREAVQSDGRPSDATGPSEKELLKSLATREPIEESPGQWQIYALEEPFPMVVGLRREKPAHPAAASQPVALPASRVVSWGLAIPKGQHLWTLFTFRPNAPTSGRENAAPEIPLPPGSSKTFSLRVSGGGTIVSFRGPGDAEAWKRFYDNWIQEHGYAATCAWRQEGLAWALQCLRRSEPPETLVVRFGPDDRGQWTGLLTQTASSDGK